MSFQDAVQGGKANIGSTLMFIGPAVVASIAYMDPGNFATNIEAGSSYGYKLLWVALTANITAMLFQALSAKLGIVTGRNLAEICRDRLPFPIRIGMWVVSEIASMATDLAEFVGGAIGISLLVHVSLIAGMVVTAVITYGILMIQGRGSRPIEIVIGGLIAVIGLCYVAELYLAPVDWGQAAVGLVVPSIPDGKALAISVGMIGATIVPHALYLHSSLTQEKGAGRSREDRHRILGLSNRECVIALAVAGAVNLAMVVMAASAFNSGHRDVADIGSAYHTLTPLLGAAWAFLFLISLIASGISSSVVGTVAGQMIMQGIPGLATT